MDRKSNYHISNKVITVMIVLGVLLGGLIGGGYALFNTKIFAEKPEMGNVNVISPVKKINIEDLDDADDETVNFIVAGVDESENLTDVLMLVNIDKKNDKISILQIPRDLYVGDHIETGKINAIYGHPENGETKIASLIKEVNKRFRLSVDHYVTITIGGFKDVVDIMGGVEVNVPQPMDDFGIYLKAGVQTLNGAQAEVLMRHRKGYSSGDMGRVETREIFLKALVDRAFKTSLSEATQIATKCYNKITTDLTLKEMLGYFSDLKSMDKTAIEFFILDGVPITPSYNGYAIYAANTEELAKLLNENFRPNSKKISSNELGFKDASELADYAYGGKYAGNNYSRAGASYDDSDADIESSENFGYNTEKNSGDISEEESSYVNPNDYTNPWWSSDDESSSSESSSSFGN